MFGSFRHKITEKISKKKKRSTGLDALTFVGIPHEFAAQIAMICDKFGITIAIRASEADQQYDRSALPKPPSLKLKSNDLFPAGVVTSIHELGRLNERGEPVNYNYGKPPEHLYPVQHYPSLQSIIRDLNRVPPRIEFIKADDNHLYFKRPDSTPGDNPFMFRIKMSDAVPPSQQIQEAHKKFISSERNLIRGKMPKSPREPQEPNANDPTNILRQHWNADWGNMGELLSHRFPLEFSTTKDGIVSPYEIYNINNVDQNIIINASNKDQWHPFPCYATKVDRKFHPVTSDMDLLWISKPSKQTEFTTNCDDRQLDIFTPINTYLEQGDTKLYAMLIDMSKCDPDKMIDMSKINIERVRSLGNLSPWEAYIMIAINQRFAEFIQHLEELFQHGAENRNPGKLTVIDGMIMHFVDGQQIITLDQEDLINFILERFEPVNFLETYEICIHPGWMKNDSRWEAVIERLSQNFDLPENVVRKASLTRRASITLNSTTRRLSSSARKLSHTLSMSNLFGTTPPKEQRKSSAPTSRLSESSDYIHYQQSQAPEVISLQRIVSKIHNPEHSLTRKSGREVVDALCAESSSSEWRWETKDKRLITVYHVTHDQPDNPDGDTEPTSTLNRAFEIQLNPDAISIHSDKPLDMHMVKALLTTLETLSPEESYDKDYRVLANSDIQEQFKALSSHLEEQLQRRLK